MNYINKNQSNNVIFTLTENQTLTNPYYLFSLTSHLSKVEYNFICNDISSATSRYNKFIVVETGRTFQNLTAGTVSLTDNGFYTYKIYEQSSPVNLDVSLVDGVLLEQGLLYVSGSTQINYIKDNNNLNYIAHR